MTWRRWFSKGDPAAREQMLEDAVRKARRHVVEQELKAVAFLSGIPGADDFQEDENKMLAVALPFMWGWHHAYAKAAGDWPTTPSMRASIQMIEYLKVHHGFAHKRARAESSALDGLWNEADPLFEAISKKGAESYSNPDEPMLAQVIAQIIRHESAE